MSQFIGSELAAHALVWNRKPVLRTIYGDFYDRLASQCRPGVTNEIGGGIGNLKQQLPKVIATISSPRLGSSVADAQRLPFADGSTDNIVMLDVLHHLPFPVVFSARPIACCAPAGSSSS